jgi:hypothetical protein
MTVKSIIEWFRSGGGNCGRMMMLLERCCGRGGWQGTITHVLMMWPNNWRMQQHRLFLFLCTLLLPWDLSNSLQTPYKHLTNSLQCLTIPYKLLTNSLQLLTNSLQHLTTPYKLLTKLNGSIKMLSSIGERLKRDSLLIETPSGIFLLSISRKFTYFWIPSIL